MNIRKITESDYNKDYINLLSQLTVVGDISFDSFRTRLELINKSMFHNIYVIEDNNKIIVTGTLLIEEKIIHNCGKVGHIEDVVVHKDYRGLKLGKKMLEYLIQKSKDFKCYKTLLDCDEKNVGFYEKCGFEKKCITMAKYFK